MSDIIHLNVGGVRYETTRHTLCAVPNTMLAAMFTEGNSIRAVASADGSYFIDRDGKSFRHVLNSMRNSELIWHEDEDEELLRQEYNYFGLIYALEKKETLSIPIFLTKEHKHQWLHEQARKVRNMDEFKELIPYIKEFYDFCPPSEWKMDKRHQKIVYKFEGNHVIFFLFEMVMFSFGQEYILQTDSTYVAARSIYAFFSMYPEYVRLLFPKEKDYCNQSTLNSLSNG